MARIKMSTREKITLGLLFAMTTLLYADQLIMSAILPELSREYGVTETTLGIIGSGFTLVGAFISIVFGFFSDRAPRKALMVLVIMVGEIPCILTGVPYFTQTIESFTILRILSGIGLGGIMPITLSVLADFFKEENRASASAWMITAWSVGSVLGVEVAGFLTNDFGWRLPFILIGVPNIPLAIIFALYAREPERGRTEEALEDLIQKGLVYKQKIRLSDFGLIFTNKTNIYTFLQGLPGTVPWGILTYWLINFFETHRGVSKEMASLIFLVLGIGSLLGGLGFAYVGEWLYKKQPRYMPLMCGAGVLLGIIPSFMLINMPLDNMTLYLGLGFFTGFLVSVASANVNAILMNVNRPEHRGSVFAVFNITNNLGQGLGPAMGGLLLPLGQIFMMNFAILWWIPCGILLLVVARYFTADRDALKKLIGERATQMAAQAKN